MVILHTEICKKKEKLEKNYLHLYLTIFLNKFLMLTSENSFWNTKSLTFLVVLCGSSTGDYPKPARRSINTKIKIYKNHKKWNIFFSFQLVYTILNSNTVGSMVGLADARLPKF